MFTSIIFYENYTLKLLILRVIQIDYFLFDHLPIVCSMYKVQPIKNAINSPTVT